MRCVDLIGCYALWRTKKVALSPSDEMRMKKVDKESVITKIGPILLYRCMKLLKSTRMQWYATSPLFLDNLHFEQFVKIDNLN